MSAVRRYGATTLTGRTCGPLMTPALWITASMRPRRFTWAATPRVSSRSDRSPTTTAAPRSRRSRTAISRSVLRAWTTTSWPSSSNVCAAARPRPSADPVMNTRVMGLPPSCRATCEGDLGRVTLRPCTSRWRRRPSRSASWLERSVLERADRSCAWPSVSSPARRAGSRSTATRTPPATWPGLPWPWHRREGTSTRLSPLDGLPVSRTRSERGREEAFRGEVEYLGAGAPAVVGGDEVVADGRREREQAARFEVVGVPGDRGELRAQVVHAAVVDAAQALCDRAVAAGPVADGEVDRQQLGGEGQRAGAAGLGPWVAAFPLDAVDHVLGASALPGVEHLLEQRAAVGEVPVEATPGDAERLRERVDPDGVGAAGGKGPQPRLDPL